MNNTEDKSHDKQIIKAVPQGKRVRVIGHNSPSSLNTDQPGWQTVSRKEKTKCHFSTSSNNMSVKDIGAAFNEVSKYI